ncbi:MAG TPA: acetyl-CoA carboxylase biotin carboxyl carrier protein [Vicinamibacterales bacterium]|jgi:acetyl-CoA carboxylase biotin carboxyl carrier protein
MDFDELRQILELIREHELTEFELEREDLKLRVKKAGAPLMAPPLMPAMPPALPAPTVVSTPAAAAGREAAAPAATEETDIELAIVKSPIVGTFYRSPDPTAPSFVEVGDSVKKSQVLCIIEAMKLMNEIDSEFDGEIVKVYVENGQPVQYGERLFAIRRK